MSDAGVRAFLAADPPHTGKLATVRKDGAPHVAPIWYALDDLQVHGTVTLSEDLALLRHWAGVIGGRYMGADQADAYGARNPYPASCSCG